MLRRRVLLHYITVNSEMLYTYIYIYIYIYIISIYIYIYNFMLEVWVFKWNGDFGVAGPA